MEKLDKELQNRVWQRVQQRQLPDMPTLGRENLKPLILAAQENSQAYQDVSRRLPGEDSQKLRRLRKETQGAIACMKGICHVLGEPVKVPQLTPEKEPVKRTLMKCCHRERRLWAEWDQRGADPEFGPVYRQLARQAAEHWAALLELLGNMPG